jgi:hypothetical protein
MLVKVVKDYYTAVKSIPKLIDASGFRNDFLASKLGVKPQTFSAKKNNGSWSENELLKLFQILDTEEVEDTYMVELMKSREGDETMTVDQLKRYINK